ncbi:MAG: cobalamin-dependent protein [bacterium]
MKEILKNEEMLKHQFWKDTTPLGHLAQDYMKTLIAGDRHEAGRLILDAVEKGAAVRDIYLRVFQPAQLEVGRLWQANIISVAQEHFCTYVTQMVMSQMYPMIFSSKKNGKKLVATSVAGELHEIGIRMVADFFEMEGWDTYYLGASSPQESIVETVVERGADLLAVSATITFNLEAAMSLVRRVRADEACKSVKILVGGRLFNVAPDLWLQVGADGYAADAQQAIEVANRWLAEREI